MESPPTLLNARTLTVTLQERKDTLNGILQNPVPVIFVVDPDLGDPRLSPAFAFAFVFRFIGSNLSASLITTFGLPKKVSKRALFRHGLCGLQTRDVSLNPIFVERIVSSRTWSNPQNRVPAATTHATRLKTVRSEACGGKVGKETCQGRSASCGAERGPGFRCGTCLVLCSREATRRIPTRSKLLPPGNHHGQGGSLLSNPNRFVKP